MPNKYLEKIAGFKDYMNTAKKVGSGVKDFATDATGKPIRDMEKRLMKDNIGEGIRLGIAKGKVRSARLAAGGALVTAGVIHRAVKDDKED